MSSLDSCPGAREESGRRLWRSLDDLADSPEFRRFVEMEFPGHARELLSGTSRRHFLKVMGASLALAGMGGISGCIRWPREEIVPFANRPEGRTPGIPVSYATSMELGGVAQALLVTSYDGRPIKVEGNPQHPQSRGAASAPAQASVLGLYDPARSRGVARRQGDALSDSTWQEVLPLLGQIRAEGGRGLAILSEPSSSPSLARLRERLRAELPEASWQEYEPLSRDNLREGARLAFGAPYRPQLALDRAEVIVCLDEDLLMTHPAALRHAREFARGRRAEASGGAMNRLHVVESVPTVTGSMADHRVAVPSREVARIAAQLAAATQARGVPVRPTGPPDLASALEGAGRPGPGVERIARDLAEHRGRSLIAVGPR
ncbi:MAG: TAT-variant-translocated molybdopterin oxidoreductase, partial [Planctomycetota bacterium]